LMGPWIFDSTNTIPAKWKNSVKSILVHEFNHSFCNPLIYKYYEKMETNSSKMFNCVSQIMRRQAYGNAKTMMCELLVRASVIQYMSDIEKVEDLKTRNEIIAERIYGFYWIDTVYNALQQYEKQRDKYPTLDSYMLELVKLLNSLETKQLIKKIEKNRQNFEIQTSIKNGDMNVSADTKELVLTFDKKLHSGSFGCELGKKGKKYIFAISGAKFNDANKNEWTLFIKLEPNKRYSISFPLYGFYDEKGNPGKKKKFYLDFKTGDKK